MITPKEQTKIADQIDLVTRQMELHEPRSERLKRAVAPILSTSPGKVSNIVIWHNAASEPIKSDLSLCIELLAALLPSDRPRKDVTPRTATMLGEIAKRIRVTASDPDAEARRGLELWNAGKKWGEVTTELGRDADQKKGTTTEIHNFAGKNKLFIRLGKPGRKSGS